MADFIFFASSVLICGALFALLEIQIEGGAGWAANLPTWQSDNRFARFVCGGRPLTGYHLYAHFFVFSAIHLPFGLALAEPTWPAELRILSFLVLFWVAEDYLWFVFNPAYGVRAFNPQRATWHAQSWWWIMPREYWIFVPVGLLLYSLSL